jgi:hypothetical protein
MQLTNKKEKTMQHTVSSNTLIKAALSATVLAGIILVTLILPAEYNIDPTGLGQKIGVTVLAQTIAPEEQKRLKSSYQLDVEWNINSRCNNSKK